VCFSFIVFCLYVEIWFSLQGKEVVVVEIFLCCRKEGEVVGVEKMCVHSLRQNMTNIFTSMIGFVVIYAIDDYMTML
jgi:hypothetical protein